MNKLDSFKRTVIKHSPEILTGMGIAGMISTTVLAVRATPKALKDIEEYKETVLSENEKIKPIDAVKVTWKHYIPAAITGTVSIACLIGANSVNAKRNAALATAYTLSEKALYDYREKVVETIGEKKEKDIQDKVAEKKIKNNPPKSSEILFTGYGDTMCFDPMSGRYFMSSVEKLKEAENQINKRMLHDITGYASLNEFYDELDLPHTDVGDILGWNTFNLIDLDISPILDDKQRPCISLVYLARPNYEYDRM